MLITCIVLVKNKQTSFYLELRERIDTLDLFFETLSKLLILIASSLPVLVDGVFDIHEEVLNLF